MMGSSVVGILHWQACETCRGAAGESECVSRGGINLEQSDEGDGNDVLCKGYKAAEEERAPSNVQQRITRSANHLEAERARHYALVEQMFPVGCEADTAQDAEPTWAKVLKRHSGSLCVTEPDGSRHYIGAEQIRDVRPGRGQAEMFGGSC